MSRAIVNCAIGGSYRKLQVSLEQRCNEYCSDVTRIFYRDYPELCPPHSIQQYAFKIFALRYAIDNGADVLLWMDCTFRPRAGIEPLWRHIESRGWYASDQGPKLAEWCSDDALRILGISRDQTRGIPLVHGGLIGLDLRTAVGIKIWAEWQRLYEAGAFNGPHLNIPGAEWTKWGNKFSGHCSDDPDVSGHRHDEAAFSWVLWSLGLAPSEYAGFAGMDRNDKTRIIERNF